jgi:hypothetical protein
MADEACKIVRHCATLSKDRVVVIAKDDAVGRAGLAAVIQTLVDLKLSPVVGSVLPSVKSNKVEPAVAALFTT